MHHVFGHVGHDTHPDLSEDPLLELSLVTVGQARGEADIGTTSCKSPEPGRVVEHQLVRLVDDHEVLLGRLEVELLVVLDDF